MLRRILLAATLGLVLAPALAQAPPPVPALPDTQRLTSYTLSASTCACAVGFALYGDGTDVDNWVQVFIGTTRYLSTDPTHGWSLSSPSGTLGAIPRPITDAVLTFNSAQTGTVQIVGARRPRRISQFPENQGVAARALNQAITDVVAQNRESWDKINGFISRALLTPPGNVMKSLPPPSDCANGGYLNFGGDGLSPTCLNTPPAGGGGGGGSFVLITRSQIPSTHILPTTVISVIGYRTVNDRGAGAVYTTLGATSTGLNAIKDADGNWWNLVLSRDVQPGWFGAYADGSSHQISGGDISANPQWRGTYTAGNEWDYVAIQEAMYAAFAARSTPGSIQWNSDQTNGAIYTSNLPLYVGSGTYLINHQILTVASHGKIEFSGKGSALWLWNGAASTTMWLCNSCSYMQFIAPTLENDTVESWGSQKPIWAIDFTSGNPIPNQLKVQQLTFYDPIIQVSQNAQGIAITPTSGAQGDTIAVINGFFGGFQSDYAFSINNDNALEITWTNTDCQGFSHNCVSITGGSFHSEGSHGESQNPEQFIFAPVQTQLTQDGADVRMFSQVGGSATSLIKGWRSEGDVIAKSQSGGGNYVDTGSLGLEIHGAFATGNDLNNWTASAQWQRGIVIQAGTAKPRAFMLVDTGGVRWRGVTSGSGTTITDSGASYGINQWVGYNLHLRFGTNGFFYNCPITANTATTITWNAGACGSGNWDSHENMYEIVGLTGGSAPNFDTLGNAFQNSYASQHSWATTAGSNCINSVNSDIPGITVGWYVVIPYGDQIAPAGNPIFPAPLIGKITAVNATNCSSGAGTSIVIDQPAAYTIATTIAYVGPTIADGSQGVRWMNFPYDVVSPSNVVNNTTLGPGAIYTAVGEAHHLLIPRTDWFNPAYNSSSIAQLGQSLISVTDGAQFGKSCSSVALGGGTVDLTQQINICNTISLVLSADTTVTVTPPNSALDYLLTLQISGSGTVSFGSGFQNVLPVTTHNPASNVPTTIVLRSAAGNQLSSGLYLASRSDTPQIVNAINSFSTTSNTLANVPGLTVTVPGGNVRYAFRAVLYIDSLAAAGGTQVAVTSSAALNAIRYAGWGEDSGAVRGYALASAVGTPVASSVGWTATNPTLIIEGSLYVGTTSTINIQFAQNTANATASVVAALSTLTVTPMVP